MNCPFGIVIPIPKNSWQDWILGTGKIINGIKTI
jgi:hypothetical protein